MLVKVDGGFVPLRRIRFVHDDGRIETIDGDAYQTEAAHIADIMPKARSFCNGSRVSNTFERRLA